MFCGYCGKEIADKSEYCIYCGRKTAEIEIEDRKSPFGRRKIVFSVFAIIIVIFCTVIIFLNTPNQRLRRALSLGERYISEMKFEEAAGVFYKALEIDPSSKGAYSGLAKAYKGLGDYEMAIDTLQDGYKETNRESFLAEEADLCIEYIDILNANSDVDGVARILQKVYEDTADERISARIKAMEGEADAGDGQSRHVEEVTSVNSLSEPELRQIADKQGHVSAWCYEDYDGDGEYEAFFLITREDELGEEIYGICFVSSGGQVRMFPTETGGYYYESEDGCYREYEGQGFFWADEGAFGSGWTTLLFSVKDGRPYALDLSERIQGFYGDFEPFTTEDDFTDGHRYRIVKLVYNRALGQFSIGEKTSDYLF